MPFRQASGLRFFQFDSLVDPQLEHGIFTRHGGVSPRPWNSLNLGGTVGDQATRVAENRIRLLKAAGRTVNSSFDVWQVHSARVIHAVEPLGEQTPQRADAILTDNSDITLMMRFADCVPILIFDPVRHAIGIAHAGWKGTIDGVSTALVKQMRRAFGSRPEHLKAGIGPSIGPDHYPVGPEVVALVRDAFGAQSDEHLRVQDGATHFDLWSANRWQLERSGVNSIEVAEICTACKTDDWFSHRGEAGSTGRFGAILGLNG
jgi:YfiH family protein